MKTILIFAVSFPLFSLWGPAFGADVPARPLERSAPAYPEECHPIIALGDEEDHVLVVYDVTVDGRTENIRVRASTNSCFHDAAIEAVKGWVFHPRMIDGEPAAQKDLETVVTFVSEETDPELYLEPTEDLNLKIPAMYPEKCMAGAKDIEQVFIRYDISTEGETKNVEVVATTNECFNESAVGSVQRWRYEPRIVDGRALERIGVETIITFKLE